MLAAAGVRRYLQTWYTTKQARPDDGQLHAHHHPVVISWPGFGILFFWQLGALLMPDSSLPCNNCVGDVQYIQGGPCRLLFEIATMLGVHSYHCSAVPSTGSL